MTEHRLSATTIRQIEFELHKAEHGLAMPADPRSASACDGHHEMSD
jgi:hypothetical protein